MLLREAQRGSSQRGGDIALYGQGLRDMFAGRETEASDAASRNFAEILSLVFQYFTRK